MLLLSQLALGSVVSCLGSSLVTKYMKPCEALVLKSPPGLDPQLLLLAAPVVTDALMHIFNQTLISEIIPTVWKTALVSPLHKCGSVDDRIIITKLPCLAKKLERLVNSQLN